MSYIKKLGPDKEKSKNLIKSEMKDEEIAWVYPYAIQKWEKINLKKMRQILVKNTEKALVYNKEAVVQELSNGLYEIERKQGAEDHKIVFLLNSAFELKWGIPQMQGVLTSDNVKVGASGTISLSIATSEVFALNVLKNEHNLTIKQIKPEVNRIIKSAMREVVPQYSIEELQKLSKDELLMLLEPSIVDSLQKMGLKSQDFDLSGLGIPPEYRTL
ncbi:MAG: SPFH domain-containing protein [Candidatus Heimdallarchaeaceae archaeon]